MLAVASGVPHPYGALVLPPDVSGGEAYLHDGRARTLDEAILWHGGEAEVSKQAYVALTAAEQLALVTFLKTL